MRSFEFDEGLVCRSAKLEDVSNGLIGVTAFEMLPDIYLEVAL